MRKFFKQLLLLVVGMTIGVGLLVADHYYNQEQEANQLIKKESRPDSQVGGLTAQQKLQLANHTYQPGEGVIIYVNNGRSSLNPKSWRKNQVLYGPLDAQGRTSAGNTAFLERRNHADTNLRTDQSVQPAGWHHNSDGQLVYNRGHLIAYSLTAGINPQTGQYSAGVVGDQDNPRNLFTETDFVNQEIQTIYETKVRHAIEHGQKVIYQATPIFRGNELVPRGINLQAISTDGRLNFNVYLQNVEPGVVINYRDGSYYFDSTMAVPVPPNAEPAEDSKANNEGQFHFYGHYPRPIARAPRHYYRAW
ncbi:DNA/RNA non-specific endonuclease [Limosilactobacillus secaliphilus]|uniref:DNA/RNA non-specific endonuclease/pyrophosphatase/phosphodiesterase domain-containing protein n=1 Tax=Limosilactobacillus secaliphilus TaxID=396268 RepID=A0A0R2I2G5_9LACO|nr:DNA/RNA non-specific endonuclease [Limosilactobacillus secaliphilus]KRN59083.1 hypothetical protein IV45_GL000120 [Limosilactobacillus secaliphilus]